MHVAEMQGFAGSDQGQVQPEASLLSEQPLSGEVSDASIPLPVSCPAGKHTLVALGPSCHDRHHTLAWCQTYITTASLRSGMQADP